MNVLTNVLICVLMDSHGRPVYTHEHTRIATDVLCVLADTHGRPVYSPRGPKSPEQSTGRVSVLSTRTNVLICVLMDSHGQTSCVCWRTPTDVMCVLNRQPTWAKITRTVHGKGQRAESKDQRSDMCNDGQPRTSYSPRGPKSPEQSTGRASVLSPRTNVLICVLMDSHGRPDQRADMCTDGQPRTSSTDVLCVLADTHGRPVCTRQPTSAKITRTIHGKGQHAESKDQRADIQPTWAKITRTVHGKGQRAESKDQRSDMCNDGQPRTSSTDVLCVLTDSHGRPPTWAKITRTVHGKGQRADMFHGKGQRAESKDQRVDMCTDGQPRTSCVC
ncbi:unnamed protein product [Brassica rapa]|uniref:Uncharacterized protein n=1 Tax=Brassica campestris TaxID=3711 RepID=A0A8D9CVK0_BRACM|nr:unnamed protein product [Brassica rapa]